MKLISPKVVILGATGTLGQTVYKYLSTRHENVMGSSRNKSDNNFLYFKFTSSHDVEKLLKGKNFTFVINCIGALKGSSEKELKLLNINLPKILLKFSKKYSYRMVHISSDAVFDNLSKKVNEQSSPNPTDSYGKTKLAGELYENALNIRTSIIGFDPNEHKGLLEHALENKKMIGFMNQEWSGATTLQLAKFIEWLIFKRMFESIYNKTRTVHFAPIGPTTKYKIIKTFSELVSNAKVKKKVGKKITRVLVTKYFDVLKIKTYNVSLKKALIELIEFDKKYVKTYKKK